ncbi:hypothetical protein BGZ76_004630 [Entomortierella beljakovae]|nr:hypothetical protein BGZ76_004630 [Entomortierella beljakovae]
MIERVLSMEESAAVVRRRSNVKAGFVLKANVQLYDANTVLKILTGSVVKLKELLDLRVKLANIAQHSINNATISNNTCQYTPERWKEYQEEVKSRRITMAGMIVVLVAMFLAMRRMVKNEEARRRQIWEPVDSSPEASILRRLAEDTQRRVAGGWEQISGSLVEGGNAASAAVGTAFTRIRNNVRNATGGRGARPEDCDDDTLEMLPNGRRTQTRRELEEDMRDFLLEGDDDDDDDDEDDHNNNVQRSRDEDGLLSSHRNNIGSGSSSRSNTPGRTNTPANATASQESFPDEPPAYDEIRTNGEGQPSLIAGLGNRANPSSSTEIPSNSVNSIV